MQLHAIGGDITRVHVDAIVNAANSTLLGGGGADGAIHRAAGPELLAACRVIRATRYPDGLPVGQAVATKGFNLPAKWVIHTVGPNRHAGQTDPGLLRAAFVNSLREAARVGAHSVAFPAISGGVYGWDMAEVARIGVSAVHEWPAAWRAKTEAASLSRQSGDAAGITATLYAKTCRTEKPDEMSWRAKESHRITANTTPSEGKVKGAAICGNAKGAAIRRNAESENLGKSPIESVTFVLFSPEALEIFQAEITRRTGR